jgi:hypothetical protein
LYGPSTALCVLVYERKRQIINRSYQTQADNIVGRMTIASLDQGMSAWRLAHKLRGCDYGPQGVAGYHLMFLALVPANDFVSAATTSGSQGPLDAALAAVPAAMDMRNKARDALNAVINQFGSADAVLGTQALGVHYKVSARPEVIATAQKLRNDLAQIAGRLLSARAWLRAGGGSSSVFAETPQPRDGHTDILPNYLLAGPLMRPLVLIHEAFHDLDGFNQDIGGNPARDKGTKYHQNDTTMQLKNAYGMSQFVLHINVGQERFLADNE